MDYELVHELFDYNADTGIFTNKINRGTSAKKGEVAGGLSRDGYWYINVNGKNYLAHRLAWFYIHGYFPEYGLDHKNRVRHHNWIDNLREASQSCNIKNSKLKKNNTSGITGVSWHKQNKKWLVQIRDKNHKAIHIGYYNNKLDAAKARYEAEIEHGYPDCNTQSTALNYINQNKAAGND